MDENDIAFWIVSFPVSYDAVGNLERIRADRNLVPGLQECQDVIYTSRCAASRGGAMVWKSGRSYSTDLRSRVLAAIDGGSPARAVAQLFQVSVSYIYKALARREATGETEARPQRNHQALKLAGHHDAIAAEVAGRPDVTLEELRAWLLADAWRAGQPRADAQDAGPARADAQKKSGRAEEQDRPDIAEQRADWRAKQAELTPTRLVFVDETGAATNMARRYGRSPRGRRLDGPVPHGHWKTTTFVGGLTSRGFIAPYVIDGPMNGAVFEAWVEQMLAPELRPGDIVIMDNLAAHKVDGVAAGDQGAAGAAALPAALLPRPQPDRAGLRQAQGPAAQGRRADRRGPVATPSASCSTCSRPPSAPTTSPTPAIHGQHEKTLGIALMTIILSGIGFLFANWLSSAKDKDSLQRAKLEEIARLLNEAVFHISSILRSNHYNDVTLPSEENILS